jgi:hypothetical protein
MTQTLLATGLQQALARDVAAGKIGFVAAEFGPNVRAWLRKVAEEVTPPATEAPAPAASAIRVYQHVADGEFAGDAFKLAEAITAAAKKAGIYNGEVALTGPMLCQLLDNMASACEQRALADVRQEGLEHGLQTAFQQAARATIPPMAVEQLGRWWFAMGYRMSARAVLAGEVVSDTRSPEDYALEHGQHLAAGAEALLAAINEEARARAEIEDSVNGPTEAQSAALQAATDACAESATGVRNDLHEFRKRHQRAQEARQAALATLPPWRAATEHDVSRLEFLPTRTPAGEKKVTWVTPEHVVQFADGTSYPLAQVEVRGEEVIRLDELNWKALVDAAGRSQWMPQEYVINDWHADLCRWLEHGPVIEVQGTIEDLAQQWDGCMYDAPGGEMDIGQAIRQAGERMLKQRSEEGGVTEASSPDAPAARQRA